MLTGAHVATTTSGALDTGGLATTLQVLGSLVVVVVLALIAARFARRATVRGGGLGLTVIDRAGLSRDAAVAVVEVAGRGLVLGVTAHGVSVLAELTAEELAVHTAAAPRSASPSLPRARSAAQARTRTPDGVRVTRIEDGQPVQEPTRATRQGSGSVLDPRTWSQAVDALRDLTVRRG